jgi:hypothetical protein
MRYPEPLVGQIIRLPVACLVPFDGTPLASCYVRAHCCPRAPLGFRARKSPRGRAGVANGAHKIHICGFDFWYTAEAGADCSGPLGHRLNSAGRTRDHQGAGVHNDPCQWRVASSSREVTVPRQPDIFVSKSARIFFRFPDHFSIAQNS